MLVKIPLLVTDVERPGILDTARLLLETGVGVGLGVGVRGGGGGVSYTDVGLFNLRDVPQVPDRR